MDLYRGSEWRKWDLHFHTPASYDYQNKGISNKEIIDCLLIANISLVVITDHHCIDVLRIKELRELARGRITILPGIEFRSELGGKESVHFIGIFPETDDKPEDLGTLWTHLQGALKITPSDVAKKGNESFYCDFKDTAEIIHKEGGIVSVHAGRKSNSVENIRNSEESKMQLKTDLLNEYVDILEVNRVEDANDYRNIVFPSVGRKLLIVTSSDNHNARQYESKNLCWINADPTFLGLRQTLVETEERVFIGDLPPKLKLVSQKQTKYINSIEIHKDANSSLNDEVWFDNNIILNSGLVAIIGNKGSGKSALLDILALMGNSHRQEEFSFLNESQFRKPSKNKSKHFIATMAWMVGKPFQLNLNTPIDLSMAERVKYIPQNFFEEICNEITLGSETELDRELQSVIFSHVSEPKRLGLNSLEEIIAFKTKETSQSISSLELRISDVNKDIVGLEEKLTNEYKQNIESRFQIKKEELCVHEEQIPLEVFLPKDTDKTNIDAVNQINDLKEFRELLIGYIDTIKTGQVNREKRISYFKRIIGLLHNFMAEYENLLQQCDQFQPETQINIRDYVEISYKEDLLKEILFELHSDELLYSSLLGEENIDYLLIDEDFQEKLGSCLLFELTEQQSEEFLYSSLLAEENYDCASIKEDFEEEVNGSLIFELNKINKLIEILQNSMNIKYENFQNYVKEFEEWNIRKSEIVGDENTFGSLNYYSKLLEDLETIPEQLEKKRGERYSIVKKIYAEILKLSDVYKDLYRPVQDFINNHPLASGRLFLNFDVVISILDFEDRFFDWISQGASGTFYTKESGRRGLSSIIAKYDFSLIEGVLGFLDDLMDNLTNDKRSGHSEKTKIKDQLRGEKDILSLYNFIFSLSYLKPKYILKLGEKELKQLSPGEKGALLLIFYLLVDKDDQPLLIDQPEHNLDNQTVYDLLVPCIKEAKQKRQIIMVTHNPNLAVVCDAEQIICASLDKKDKNTVTYISGSIENPQINQRVIDVLEGTKPAFNNREQKYQSI